MFAFNDASSDVPLKTPVKLPEFLPYAIPLVEPVVFGQVPNIQGELRSHNSDFTQPTGVFSIGSIQATGQGTDQGSTGSWVTYFYASRASSIYGGDNVQSPAIQVLPCIRT